MINKHEIIMLITWDSYRSCSQCELEKFKIYVDRKRGIFHPSLNFNSLTKEPDQST